LTDKDGTSNEGNSTNITIVPEYGSLSVNIAWPTNGQAVTQNSTFNITANITCLGDTGATCGTVYAYARYNESANVDTNIDSTKGATPMYITEGGALQLAELEWNKTSIDQYAKAIAIDNQSDVYVTGLGGADSYYTIKYDSNGTQIWNKTDTNGHEGRGIATDTLGNVYVTGYNGSFPYEYYTVKYNSTNGAHIWNITDTNGTTAEGIATDNQGNIYVTGTNSSDYYTVKYNATTGAKIWNVMDINGDIANGIATDDQGSVYVTGTNGSDYYTVKYNATNGAHIWNVTDINGDTAYDITTDTNGDVYITGQSSSDYYYTVKYNATNGAHIWNVTDTNGWIAYGIATDTQGNVYVTGTNGSVEVYTVKYNGNTGEQLGVSEANWIDAGANGYYPRGIVVDSQFNFYITGYVDFGIGTSYKTSKNTQESSNEQSTTLSKDQTWTMNWTVNATGEKGNSYFIDVLFNSSYGNSSIPDNDTEDRKIKIAGPPNTPSPTINSSDGSNSTSQNLNCVATITDNNNDTMNVTVKWYKDDILNLSIDYNNSYANGTTLNATLGSENTTRDDIWKCGLTLTDKDGTSNEGNSTNITILPLYGTLNVNIKYPENEKNINQNKTFNITANVTCTGEPEASCGTVYAFARYNASGQEPDTLIGGLPGDTPFRLFSGAIISPTKLWNVTDSKGGIAYDVAVDDAGNVYVTGDDGISDFYTVKYNSSGVQIWNVTEVNGEIGYGVAVDSAGNVYVIGTDDSTVFYTVKYNSSGDQIWNVTEGNGTIAYGIAVDDAGNVYVTGTDANTVFYTVKYNSSGDQIWNVTEKNAAIAYGIAVDDAGNVYVTGNNGSNNYYTVKYNSSGSQIWNITDTTGTIAGGIAVDDNENVYVTGTGNLSKYYTVKYNSSGDQIWNVTDSNGLEGKDIVVDSFGNIYVTGADLGNFFYTVKYNSSGSQIWNTTEENGDIAKGVTVDIDGNVYITGNDGSNNYYTVKYAQEIINRESTTLDKDESWNVSWIVNATGAKNTTWYIDVLFNSSYGNGSKPENDTEDRLVCIGCPVNNASVMNSSRITPITAYSFDLLVGYCNATDVENDDVLYYYKWYRNEVLNDSGTADNNSANYTQGVEVNVANISSSLINAYDNWTLSCAAYDGNSNSTWMNSTTISITNTLPSFYTIKNDSNTLLLDHFENSQTTSSLGGTISGVDYITAKYYKGASFNSSDTLTYTSANNFNSSVGTIEMWVKPNWDGNDGIRHYFFDEIGTAKNKNRLTLFKSNQNYLICSIFDDSRTETSASILITTWITNEWHHIACTWNETRGITLYIDGTIAGEENNTFTIATTETNMHIGTQYDDAWPAEAIIDELRISDIERTSFPAKALIYPTDTQQIKKNITSFNWTNATDPDGDTIYYNLIISNSNNYSEINLNITGITDTNYTMDESQGLLENSYYWKIIPSDNREGERSNETWTFTLDYLPPTILNSTYTPQPAYSDNNITFKAIIENGDDTIWYGGTWEDGSWQNYTNNIQNESTNYNVTINATYLSNQETIQFRWYANKTGGTEQTGQLIEITIQNRKPTQPNLLYPGNDTTLQKDQRYTELNWTNTTDPDEDNINFTVYGSSEKYNVTNTEPGSIIYQGTNLEYNWTGLNLDQTYYWKVEVFDGYDYNESVVYQFNTDSYKPIITNIVPLSSQIPVENSTKEVNITFTVDDLSGNNTINVSSALAIYSLNGVQRNSLSCSGTENNATSLNITCPVDMQYYNLAGTWTINVSVQDNDKNLVYNDTKSFTYGELYAFSLTQNTINFPSSESGTNNVNSSNDPQIIVNTGNMNFTYINITGYDLTNGIDSIGFGNFTVNATGDAKGMIVANNIQIPGATLIVNSTQNIYFWVDLPTGLSNGTYNTNSSTQWVIEAYN
ncbi:SBBP repeat-containing protein, partial [Bacteroidota bacterium]